MDVPDVKISELELISVNDDDYVTVMSINGDFREDLKLPSKENWADLVEGIKKAVQEDKRIVVVVLRAINIEMIVSFKEIKG